MKSFKYLSIFLSFFFLLHANNLDSKEIVKGELGAKLNKYLTRITPFGFSGAVLIAKNEEIIINKGYGLAIRDKGIPCDSETVFSLGSITKQFTAAGIMKLEMMGKLNTHDPISKYLNEVPKDKRKITLHHLLTHTAGVISFTGFDYEPVNRDETVKKILLSPLEFQPGERFSYSNAGYSLLAAILEKVSGQSYEEFLHEHLFKPAGMNFTGYRIPDWSKRVVAHWYVGDIDNGTPLEKPYPYWNLLGNGGILSTTNDMFKWYLALKGNKILSEHAKKKIFTPFLNDYGYGWDILKTEHGTLIQHNGGSMLGNSADFRWFVNKDIAIIIFCNQSYDQETLSDIIKDKIASIVFGRNVEMPPEIKEINLDKLKKYEGIYKLPSGGFLKASFENRTLKIKAKDQDAINALMFPEVSNLDLYKDLNSLSVKIFESVLRGDFKPFGEVLVNKKERFERVRKFINMRLERYKNYTGSIREVKAVGTLPSQLEEGAVETVVELKGEKNSIFFLLIWQDGRNIGVAPIESPQIVSIPFLPLSKTKFAGYHLGLAKIFKINFIFDNKNSITGLILPKKGGKIFAQKVK